MNKKQQKYESVTLTYPVHLFLEDLLSIESVLKDELKVEDLNISFDDYETKSISEIPEGTRTNNVNFKAYRPYVSIGIETQSRYPRIYLDDITLETEGALFKIGRILKNRKRVFLPLLQKVVLFMSYLLCIVWASLSALAFEIGNQFARQHKNFILYSLIGSLIFLVLSFRRTPSIVEFVEKGKRKNFFQRNTDQIIVGLIVASFSAILGFILGLLVRK